MSCVSGCLLTLLWLLLTLESLLGLGVCPFGDGSLFPLLPTLQCRLRCLLFVFDPWLCGLEDFAFSFIEVDHDVLELLLHLDPWLLFELQLLDQ